MLTYVIGLVFIVLFFNISISLVYNTSKVSPWRISLWKSTEKPKRLIMSSKVLSGIPDFIAELYKLEWITPFTRVFVNLVGLKKTCDTKLLLRSCHTKIS